jgi:hypothetical protein
MQGHVPDRLTHKGPLDFLDAARTGSRISPKLTTSAKWRPLLVLRYPAASSNILEHQLCNRTTGVFGLNAAVFTARGLETPPVCLFTEIYCGDENNGWRWTGGSVCSDCTLGGNRAGSCARQPPLSVDPFTTICILRLSCRPTHRPVASVTCGAALGLALRRLPLHYQQNPGACNRAMTRHSSMHLRNETRQCR